MFIRLQPDLLINYKSDAGKEAVCPCKAVAGLVEGEIGLDVLGLGERFEGDPLGAEADEDVAAGRAGKRDHPLSRRFEHCHIAGGQCARLEQDDRQAAAPARAAGCRCRPAGAERSAFHRRRFPRRRTAI